MLLKASLKRERGRGSHPALPLTPQELARDAALAVEAALVSVSEARATSPQQTSELALRFSLHHGHDVRIGLEDTLAGPDGTPARDNRELVATARRLIERAAGGGGPGRFPC